MISKILSKLYDWANPIYIANYGKEYSEEEYDDVLTRLGSFNSSSNSNATTALTSVTITNQGYGYSALPSMTLGHTNALGALGAPGGLGATSGTWNINTSKPVDTLVNGELLIKDGINKPIRVAETLTAIIDQLGIIVPDKTLNKKYPALKMAWEDYNEEFQKVTRPKSLQDAIDNYKMTESLVKADDKESN